MSEVTIVGSCLCGAVTYEIAEPFKLFQYCHCSRCRKFTGSAHAANLFVSPDKFRWLTGQASVHRYELPNAKYFATSFCEHCGSSLPWMSRGGKVVVVPAGTLDDVPELHPQQNIFWESKAPWYEEAANLPKFAELPTR